MNEPRMDVRLDAGALSRQLADDVRAGLTASPKVLAPKYFYDARGSELFDQITRLPEYYPTRTEAAILAVQATEIAKVSDAETLLELGSGTSEKTRTLLTALTESGTLRRFVPFDVDPVVLEEAARAVGAEFPGLLVEPEVGDFERHLGDLPHHPRTMVAFLGSTIGNFTPDQRAGFLASVRAMLRDGDCLLLGTDLVKDPERLVAAYDDRAGVTAAFNKNVLAVINSQLDADFDLEAFAHRAVWVEEHEWIEMRLESLHEQQVHLRALDLVVDFAAGEQVRTEISAKFRAPGMLAELAAAGLRLEHWWTDGDNDFALSLSVPA